MKPSALRTSARAILFGASVLLAAGCGGPSLPLREEMAPLSASGARGDSTPSTTSEPTVTEAPVDSIAPKAIEKPSQQAPTGGTRKEPANTPTTGFVKSPQPTKEKPLDGDADVKSAMPTPPAEPDESVPAEETPLPSPVKNGEPETLKFSELYADITVRGIKLSDKVNRLNGQKVEMTGFMAPPLSATVSFFVLTKVALSICPFCSTDADWPTDIVVVFMPDGKEIKPTEHQVKVTGTLSVGSQTDEETGFVSLIRINAVKTEVLS